MEPKYYLINKKIYFLQNIWGRAWIPMNKAAIFILILKISFLLLKYTQLKRFKSFKGWSKWTHF